MQMIITASLAFLFPCHTWDKPLNPILGETFQGELEDGTKVFLEQVCHKPPISYVLAEG
jgi:Oxysterol-binding protein